MNNIYISLFVSIFILFANFSNAISAEINYNNGDKYVGEVVNGLPHGVGTLYRTNKGQKATGEFKYGKLNGVATLYITKNGIEATCGWKNNNPDQCVYTLQNGKKMLVTFKNNKPISKKPLQRHETYHTIFQKNVQNVQDNSNKYEQEKIRGGGIIPFACRLQYDRNQDECIKEAYRKYDENSKKTAQLEKERAIIKKNREMKQKEINEKKIRLCNSSKNVTDLSTVFWENLATQLQVNMLNPNYKIIDVKWVEFGTFLFIPLGGSCMVKIYTEKGACNAPVDVMSDNGKKYFHSYEPKPCMHSF